MDRRFRRWAGFSIASLRRAAFRAQAGRVFLRPVVANSTEGEWSRRSEAKPRSWLRPQQFPDRAGGGDLAL